MIKFIREYTAIDKITTIYDVIYESRVKSYYITNGEKLPKTITNFIASAKVREQLDKMHGHEKIYEK